MMNDEWKEMSLIGYYGIREDIKNWMKKKKKWYRLCCENG